MLPLLIENCIANLSDDVNLSRLEPNSVLTQVSLSIAIRTASSAGLPFASGNKSAKFSSLPPPVPKVVKLNFTDSGASLLMSIIFILLSTSTWLLVSISFFIIT